MTFPCSGSETALTLNMATAHLSPLELRLLERVEMERASLLPASSSPASAQERREAQLSKRWARDINWPHYDHEGLKPRPTGPMQFRVLILGSNCRKQEKVWQHIKSLIAKFKKRFVKVIKCPLVHVIFSGKTLGRNHALIYLAWHALGQTFSKKWNMMPLLHWMTFSSKVDYYNRLKRFTIKAGAGSSNRLYTSRFCKILFARWTF